MVKFEQNGFHLYYIKKRRRKGVLYQKKIVNLQAVKCK